MMRRISACLCVLPGRRQGNLLDCVRARVAESAGAGGFRRLPVTMTVPPWEKPALMVRWLALVTLVEVAMGAIAAGADAQAGRAARGTQEIQETWVALATLARPSAPVGHPPTMQAEAKGTPSCRGKDRARGATEPGLTVALKMTVGTVRAQMRSPTP